MWSGTKNGRNNQNHTRDDRFVETFHPFLRNAPWIQKVSFFNTFMSILAQGRKSVEFRNGGPDELLSYPSKVVICWCLHMVLKSGLGVVGPGGWIKDPWRKDGWARLTLACIPCLFATIYVIPYQISHIIHCFLCLWLCKRKLQQKSNLIGGGAS